jgi:plastocyanin domain-containing protein
VALVKVAVQEVRVAVAMGMEEAMVVVRESAMVVTVMEEAKVVVMMM